MPIKNRRPVTSFGGLAIVLAILGILLATFGSAATAAPNATAGATTVNQMQSHPSRQASKPTVVLVHGAWADASGWAGELQALDAKGYEAIALANPLRGLTSDAAYIRSVLDTIPGPVVLVGHSYGGAVISVAAAGADNVKALVYVAAFVPDEGEPVGLLTQLNPGSLVTDEALEVRPYPTPDGGTSVDLYLRSTIFRAAFAADLPRATTRLMWATQRPLAAAAFGEPAGAVAWHTIPSWYVLATQDKTIPPATQAYMAGRAHAHVTEVSASHVAMMSQPGATTKVILDAVHAVD